MCVCLQEEKSMQGNQRSGQIPESSWFGHVANKLCTKYSVFPFAFLLVLFTYLSSLMQESRITVSFSLQEILYI